MDERVTEWLPAWVAVIGTGSMGSGIAQVFAVSGLQVTVYDASMDQVERALSTMQANLARRVSTGRLEAAAAEEALVRGQHTSDETLGVVRRLAARCGKEVVHSADSQGFITSRLIAIVILEAMRIVQEGVADVADVDRACRLAFNWPMGPIELAGAGV
jgi:3-hydroxyacyl-CoA dehydrogenase